LYSRTVIPNPGVVIFILVRVPPIFFDQQGAMKK
jgi:hypothetical protein